MTFDGKAFGADIVAIVKGHMERNLAPIMSRLEAMEKAHAALPLPKDGAPGKSVTLDDVAPLISREVERAVSAIPKPKDGEDGVSIDVDAVKAVVSEAVASAVAAIPTPKDGADVDMDAVKALVDQVAATLRRPQDGKDIDPEAVRQMIADAVASLPPAENGKDADPVEVAAQIAAEVERAVAALPAPQDGKSIGIEDVRPVIDEAVSKAVAALPAAKDGIDGKDGRDGIDGRNGADGINGKDGAPGRDGADVVDLLIDRAGELIVTLSDGRAKSIGPVIGRDGVDADMAALSKQIADAVASIPAPKDGIDGFGFDDMDVHHDGERGFTLRFTKGEHVKEFLITVPVVLDRGVFKDGQTYQKGDGVTWGGSFWIAQVDTGDKPDVGKGWRLAVKRGRDGKDGVVKHIPAQGPVSIGKLDGKK